MTLEEAITTAIEYETRVHAAYKEAHDRAGDEVGRRVFGTLAREEAGHIAYLRRRLAEWKESGTLTDEVLESAVPPAGEIEAKTRQLGEKLNKTSPIGKDEVRLLEKALKVEQETSDFYRRMVDELDGQGRRLFARFLEIEEGHGTIVQAEIDAANGHGFWFDIPEFRLG
ncbi:MAG: ferritin family protein [Acidobacteriota bacterium]|nr:ferritin family protein [Acidobacteriota bacterium]MDQ7087349.1 ferritin family protein [Acidobacteriota bacterium]